MENKLIQALEARRTIYDLGDDSPISDKKIEELIGKAVLNVPTAFNSQNTRVVILFANAHKKLWKITEDALRAIVPSDKFASTEEKMRAFSSAHGTILYFNDSAVTQNLMAAYPLYKDNFPVWAEQGVGMLQFEIWQLLADAGIGASLQHYNPLIDAKVKAEWHIPETWKLTAEMPFGSVRSQPDDKEFEPLEKRLFVFDK